MWRKLTNEEIAELEKRRSNLHNKKVELGLKENALQENLNSKIYVAKHTEEILKQYEDEFALATKLQSEDIKFVFLATGLQCIRQYGMSFFPERLDDKSAAKKVKGAFEEHSDRKHKYYMPSLEEIIKNPVPFDAIYGSRAKGLGIGGGFQHRAKTLGHDPVLGWIFGTMNILTSTLTMNDFRTFHVKTGNILNRGNRDWIFDNADTRKMIVYSLERFKSKKREDIMAIGVSLYKEALHLKSDINSIAGLPLPVVSTISLDAAKKLAEYGLDMGNVANVGKQAMYAEMINSIIAMLHLLICGRDIHDAQLFEVRTRKIISCSNLIATSSNLIATGIGVATENTTLMRAFDAGGLAVTLQRLISDDVFISELKREFIVENYLEMI